MSQSFLPKAKVEGNAISPSIRLRFELGADPEIGGGRWSQWQMAAPVLGCC